MTSTDAMRALGVELHPPASSLPDGAMPDGRVRVAEGYRVDAPTARCAYGATPHNTRLGRDSRIAAFVRWCRERGPGAHRPGHAGGLRVVADRFHPHVDSAAGGWWYPVVVITLLIAGADWKTVFHLDPDRPGETVLPPWMLTSGAALAAMPSIVRLLDGRRGGRGWKKPRRARGSVNV